MFWSLISAKANLRIEASDSFVCFCWGHTTLNAASTGGDISVFTFGRDHEKACAANYLRDPADLPTIHGVIDAVHDLLESKRPASEVRAIISDAFTNGRSGVWEQTGDWLLKLCRESPGLTSLWLEFAAHKSGRIRFRVAAFICDMPESAFQEVLPKLLADSSANVRSKVIGDLTVAPRKQAVNHLANRLVHENDEAIRDELKAAIEATRALD